jgi:acid stress-induced BolA-like protein IbaG/YrbA
MTKLKLVETIRAAIQEWAQQHSIELALLEVEPTGIGSDVRIIVVARKGFENWPEIDRDESLYQYLRSKLGDADIVKISLTITMSEEEYDQYDRVEVS